MSRRKRKPNVSAVINASMQIAQEQADEFLRILDRIEELHELNKRKSSAAPAPADTVVAE